MRQILLILLALQLFATKNQAQNHPNLCQQTSAEAAQIQARLEKNLAAKSAAADRGTTKYVPVRFHLVADSEGKNRWARRKALDLLCQMNRDFAPAEIQFFLSEENGSVFDETLNNTLVFEKPLEAKAILNAARSPKAVNIFMVKDLGLGTITAGIYSPSDDWIVLEDAIELIEGTPASHEMGHFLSLLHTFHTMEGLWASQLQPGVVPPATINGQPLELMDGSNCDIATDLLCDTPPDYGIPTIAQGCKAQPGLLDPNGVPIDPMENNVMAAYSGCMDYVFTKQQIEAMLADLATPERNYLKNTYQPPTTSLTMPTDLLIAPAANEKIETFDEVELDWKPVAGATHYLVEVSIVPSFAESVTQSWLLSDDFFTLNSLLKNRKYYWRVRPFNHTATCDGSQTGSFSTGQTSGTSQFLTPENRVEIFPNPLLAAENLRLHFDFAAAMDLKIEVLEVSGRLAFFKKLAVPSGMAQLELPAASLPVDMFFLKIESERGAAVWKILR